MYSVFYSRRNPGYMFIFDFTSNLGCMRTFLQPLRTLPSNHSKQHLDLHYLIAFPVPYLNHI